MRRFAPAAPESPEPPATPARRLGAIRGGQALAVALLTTGVALCITLRSEVFAEPPPARVGRIRIHPRPEAPDKNTWHYGGTTVAILAWQLVLAATRSDGSQRASS